MPVQPVFLNQRVSANGIGGDDRWEVTPCPPSPIFVMDIGGKAVMALLSAPTSKIDAFVRDAKGVLSSLELAR